MDTLYYIGLVFIQNRRILLVKIDEFWDIPHTTIQQKGFLTSEAQEIKNLIKSMWDNITIKPPKFFTEANLKTKKNGLRFQYRYSFPQVIGELENEHARFYSAGKARRMGVPEETLRLIKKLEEHSFLG
jgi:uncharacterized protein YlaN (UPF0358 family)